MIASILSIISPLKFTITLDDKILIQKNHSSHTNSK